MRSDRELEEISEKEHEDSQWLDDQFRPHFFFFLIVNDYTIHPAVEFKDVMGSARKYF